MTTDELIRHLTTFSLEQDLKWEASERLPCRALMLDLLGLVDSRGEVSAAELAQWLAESRCDESGHSVSMTDLDRRGYLTMTETGRAKLSSVGEAHLIDHGRPAADWSATAPPSIPHLREWQIEALNAWVAHGRRGVVQAVTGTGKSRVGIEAAREALALGQRVLICVPTVDLVEQWHRALVGAGISGVGKLGNGHKASFEQFRLVVGTIQSLHRRPPMFSDHRCLLIADECHRYGANEWSAILQPSYASRLGLTATFERDDDGLRTLMRYFGGGPVYSIGFGRAIADGVVAHYDVKMLGVDLKPDEQTEYDEADETVKDSRLELVRGGVPSEPFGEFMHQVARLSEEFTHPLSHVARRYLNAFSRRIDVLANARGKVEAVEVLEPVIHRAKGAIVFTRRIGACETLSSALNAIGVQSAPIHSDLGRSERSQLLRALRAGRLQVLVAPTILDEGLDLPDVELGIVMGGTKFRRQMIQRMGRVLRLKQDGRKATFVVVYARGTTEDLTRTDGREGCLDLIAAHADSVEVL